MTVRKRAWLGWCAAVFLALFAATSLTVGMLRAPGWEPFWVVVEFSAAAVASAMAARTAARCSGQRRRAWVWLSAGAAAWALGEAWWAVRELLMGGTVGVPSPADIGFLLLPPCAAAGVLVHPAARAVRLGERVRLLLDAATVSVALLLLAWQFPIAAVLDPKPTSAAVAVALTYPVADAVLAAILLTLLTYGITGRGQTPLIWLLAGLLALTGADSVYVDLTADRSVTSTSIADVLWTLGFAAFAVAAAIEIRREEDRAVPEVIDREWLSAALLAGSVLLVAARQLMGARIDRVTVLLLATMGVLVYLRQYFLFRDKHRLLAQLRGGRTQLRDIQRQDPVTRLPNRSGFLELVGEALERLPGQPLGVVKLSPVYPHLLTNLDLAEADAVLCSIAERINDCLLPGDRLARVSETTFAAVMAGDREVAVGFAQRVVAGSRAPVSSGHRQLHVAFAAGVALTTGAEVGKSAATLIQRAGIALNSVTEPLDAIAVFTASMQQIEDERLARREVVARALRDDFSSDLEVLFEPLIELSTGHLAGIAARAVLLGHADDVISAGQIVTLARESGMAERLDAAVLTEAIGQFGGWTQRWAGTCKMIWVVICIETFARPGFLDWLSSLLETSGVAASSLVLEPLAGDGGPALRSASRLTLQLLRDLGVRVVGSDSMDLSERSADPDAVDDFVVDYFDISPWLVERCGSDLRARRLVQATTEFAGSRQAETSARQVSTIEQHVELLQAGCVMARGPLYGTSLPITQTEELLAAVSDGTWVSPVGQLARRSRASRAWQDLRTVISSLPIAAFACAMDGTLVLAEGALLERLGAAAVLGRPLAGLAGDEPVPDANPPLADALRSAFDGESTRSTIQARGRWLQVYLSPEFDDDGAVTGALGVAIDVTHQVEAEQALRQSEQRLKAIFAEAPVGMAIVSADSHLLEVNSALAAMLGYLPAELVGRSLTSMRHPDTPSDSAEQYERFRVGQVPGYRAERAYRHRDGSAVWTRITVGSLADDHAPGTTIAIVEDLRSVKQLEVDLRHAQKLEAVGMLAAGIAHEINTPTQFVGDNLNFLGGAFDQLAQALTETQRLSRAIDEAAATELAQLAEEIDLPWLLDEIPGAVSQSLDGVTRVATIVSAMRNFGHPDAREPSPVDIDAAIRDTTAVSRNEYKYVADLSLELGDVPTILGYPSQFHQVMLNLIVNAAHAIEESLDGTTGRGTIRIRTWTDDTTVHVSVTDDGCGISPRTRTRIFDPFFTTKAVGRGTGQGLAIVHNVIVERHHGTIDVVSTPGHGTTLTLHLPRPVTKQDGATPVATVAATA